VLEALPLGRGLVLRTSWLYGPVGSNFCRTMLRLHRLRAAASEPLQVVADQVGCPTSTLGLAQACWRALGQPLPPILHWSDAGVASWYDFAVAIGELAVAAGLLQQAAEVEPITTSEYPTPAQRPSYSLLDCTQTHALLALKPPHWRMALAEVLEDLAVGDVS
jgi:dTDP-4-dehydrorhamnose reductase